MSDVKLDVQGLLCPLPVLKAKKALRQMASGEKIEVITTDPGAVADFQCLAEEDDDLVMVEQREADGVCVHILMKA